MPWLHSAGVCCSPHLQRGQLTAHRRAVSTAVACILFLLFYFPEIPFVVWTPFHLGAVSFAGGVQYRPTAPSPPHSSSFAWIQWLRTSPASPASSRQAPVSSRPCSCPPPPPFPSSWAALSAFMWDPASSVSLAALFANLCSWHVSPDGVPAAESAKATVPARASTSHRRGRPPPFTTSAMTRTCWSCCGSLMVS
ncbi:hypothetical protein VPH35_104611 [Triticum aestivum]